MKMKIKRYWPLFVVALIVLALIISQAIASRDNQPGNNDSPILFYGETCPHCQNVEEYLSANKVRERFSFQELEVYNNTINAALLTRTAKKCGLDTARGVGVPFLYDGERCLLGDRDIINFFQSK